MMVSIRSVVVTRLMVVLYCCRCSVRTAYGFSLDTSAGPANLPVRNAFVRRQVPTFHTTTAATRIDLQASVSATALKSSARDVMTMIPMTTVPLWPYLGCTGQCGGGPLGLFLALALCGAGLPLSEDVLLIGLAPRLFHPNAPTTYKILCVAAAVAGVATADTLTVALGRAIRVNSKVIGERAPRFLGRMLAAVRTQLVVESKRDGARLREQIEGRLRSATIDLGEQLRRLQAAIGGDGSSGGSGGGGGGGPSAAPRTSLSVLWRRLAAGNDLMRRITCNTRTSLAAWGQTSAALTKIVLSRGGARFGLPPFLTPPTNGGESTPSPTDDRSRSAGIDNRLALGQRWPLALLTGVSADEPGIRYGGYFTGAALAAATVTVPVQLLLGAVLRRSEWARGVVYLVIGTAQLCRYGPIWAAVFVAIGETVREEIEDVRRAKEGGS